MSTTESTAGSDLPPDDLQPAWEVAHLFPPQGHWDESDFLRIHTNRMAELVDGHLEILPTPTWVHAWIVDFFVTRFKRHLQDHSLGGHVFTAVLPVRLFEGTIREPDVMYFAPGSEPPAGEEYPSHVDLAIEVVSEGSDARKRDYVSKRHDDAKAGVPEYWIVDPFERRITVLSLRGGQYAEVGRFEAGQTAHSELLAGFHVQVDDVFAKV